MPLTAEQIAEMNAITGLGPETKPLESEYDAGNIGFDGGAPKAFGMALANNFPFGQEITSQAAAAAMAPFTPLTRKELLEQARADTEETFRQHPYASGFGTATGIAATLPLVSSKAIFGAGQAATQGLRGAINEIPKGLSKVSNFVRGGQVARGAGAGKRIGIAAGQAVRGVPVAAPLSGLYAAGDSAPGERIEGFGRGARMGATVAAALPVGGAVLGIGGRAILPKIDESLASVALLAKKHDIPVSFDQITESRAVKTLQKVSQDLPFSGQAGFRGRQLEAVNKALLKTIGMKGKRFSPVQMDKAFTDLGREFEGFGKGEVFDISPVMERVRDLSIDAGDIYGLDARGNLSNMVTKIVKQVNEQSKNGTITGESLGRIRKDINKKMRKTENFETKSVFADLESSIIDVMSEQNPKIAAAFKNTKHKYKNLLVLEPVASKAKGGNINPTLLNNRVLKIYGRQHTRGKSGDIGEIARVGHELLPELGGSDTLSKSVFAIGAGGGALAAPVIATSVVAGNRLLQSAVNRNQAIINRVIRKSENGGKITQKDISKLPPKDAKSVMSFAKGQTVVRGSSLNNKENK